MGRHRILNEQTELEVIHLRMVGVQCRLVADVYGVHESTVTKLTGNPNNLRLAQARRVVGVNFDWDTVVRGLDRVVNYLELNNDQA